MSNLFCLPREFSGPVFICVWFLAVLWLSFLGPSPWTLTLRSVACAIHLPRWLFKWSCSFVEKEKGWGEEEQMETLQPQGRWSESNYREAGREGCAVQERCRAWPPRTDLCHSPVHGTTVPTTVIRAPGPYCVPHFGVGPLDSLVQHTLTPSAQQVP